MNARNLIIHGVYISIIVLFFGGSLTIRKDRVKKVLYIKIAKIIVYQ